LVAQVLDSFKVSGEIGFQAKAKVNLFGLTGTATAGALNYSIGTSAVLNIDVNVKMAEPGSFLYGEVAGGVGKTKFGVARDSVVDGISVRRGPYEDYSDGFFFEPSRKFSDSDIGKLGAHIQAGIGINAEVDFLNIGRAFFVCPYQ
jgi:hypothetical protein